MLPGLEGDCMGRGIGAGKSMNATPRRIALYGGSFDPVHPSHVAIARAARGQAGLDQVVFLPARQSPLKGHGPEAEGPLRVEMLRAALTDCPWAEVDAWELDQPGPSYSWQTVEHFQKTGGDGIQWFWLMGADQWDQLERWQNWRQLAGRVTFLVFARSGVIPQPRAEVNAVFLSGEFPGPSSTTVRKTRCEGGAWEPMVAPGVAAVILREGLYLD